MKSRLCFLALLLAAFVAKADELTSVGGVKIGYTVLGSGTPVVLIHGLHGSAATNWALPGITALLAKNHQVIAMDCRGHGHSEKPQTEADYGVKMVEDVIALLNHLDLRKANLIGYSMGGMIAMKTAALHPERVKTLMLCVMGWLQEGGLQQRLWENIPARKRLFGGNSSTACMNGMAHLAVTAAEVKALKMPAAIIVGDQDPVDRLYVAPLTQIRPDWPVTKIAGAGHISCIMKPDFQAAVVTSLAKLESN